MTARRRPGEVRDAINRFLAEKGEARIHEIVAELSRTLGSVAPSSVRSYLNLNTGTQYDRIGRGRYRLRRRR